MTNGEKWIINFKKQFPEFEQANISINLFGDIMDLDTKTVKRLPLGGTVEGHEIIAVSNLAHNLDKLKQYDIPTQWTLTDYGKSLL